MKFEAHRGVGTEFPENTMPAFQAAVDRGFSMIEFDPKMTRDMVAVILHDKTIGRTARNLDKTPAPDLKIADLDYQEAAQYDYGLSFGDGFGRVHLPKVSELFVLAKKNGIALKVDNVFESFTDEGREVFLSLCEEAQLGTLLGLTSARPESIVALAARFPEATMHYDGPIDEEILVKLSAAALGRLYVWIRLDCKRTAWSKLPAADENTAKKIKPHAKLGLWLADSERDIAEAERLGADIVETTGRII